VGIKKRRADSVKKKRRELPKRAAEGRLRKLSIAAMIRMVREKKEIFLGILLLSLILQIL
jgi:hypothetical protein